MTKNAMLRVVDPTVIELHEELLDGEGSNVEACGSCWAYVGDLCKRFPNAVPKDPTDWCGEYQACDEYDEEDDEEDE